MQLFSKNNKEENAIITLIVEFTKEKKSLNVIARLSDYISTTFLNSAQVLTDLQSHPAGYRITYKISHDKRHKKSYHVNKLAKLSDWLNEDSDCISRYHYNVYYYDANKNLL